MYNFFEIKNKTDTCADVYIYGDIVFSKWDETDVTPTDIVEALKEIADKKLNIYINSCGGSVFAGMAIYNILKRHAPEKTVYVDGIAASIASIIALAGDRVIMPKNAYYMIHKPYSFCVGNSDKLIKTADNLDKIEQGMYTIYESYLTDGVSIDTIKEMVKNETWLTGEEAGKYFRFSMSEEKQIAAYTGEYAKYYNKLPEIKTAEPKESDKQININNLKMELELASSFVFERRTVNE